MTVGRAERSDCVGVKGLCVGFAASPAKITCFNIYFDFLGLHLNLNFGVQSIGWAAACSRKQTSDIQIIAGYSFSRFGKHS